MTENCRACVIVLVGLPGSGKSEWSRKNSDGAIVVSRNELIDTITPSGFDPFHPQVYEAVEDAIAHAGAEAGCPVIVNRTNRTRALRRRWIGIDAAHGCHAVAVEMTADTDLCNSRNRARTDHRRITDDRMEQMIPVIEPLCLDEGYAAIFHDDEVTLFSILEHLHLTRSANDRIRLPMEARDVCR